MKRITVSTALTTLVGLWTMTAFAAVPQLINFQGILRDGSGNPVANGLYFATFRIYDAPSGGTVLWVDTQTVATSAGLFNAVLGRGTPVSDSVFNDSVRYLGVQVFPDAEMTPRPRISSVGYSHNSSEWTSAGQNLFRLNGHVGIGTTTPLSQLHISSGNGQGVPPVNQGLLINNNAAASNYASLTLIGGSSAGTFLSFGDYTSPFKGNIAFDNSTSAMSFHTNFGVRMNITNNGNVGIGTSVPLTKLHVAAGSGQGVPAVNPGLLINNNAAAPDYASLTLIGGSTGGTFLSFGDNISPFKGNIGFDNSTQAMSFHTNSGVRMTVTNNGNVGIATASPGEKLEVNGALKFSGDANVISRAPRVIRTNDARPGCPPVAAANTDFLTQNFTLTRPGMVFITVDMVRNANGRADLELRVDGATVQYTIAYTPIQDWQGASVHWTGTLAAGAHTVAIRSPQANVWGCGSSWGGINTIIFE